MEERPSSTADVCSASKEISRIFGSRKFIFLFTNLLNQIDQFSVITHLSVLIHLLLCLPSGFVLIDISTLCYIHLYTPAHAACPERLYFCFYKPPLLVCTINQIDQFSLIIQFSVLVYLLLFLPSGFVLVDISTLFYIHLHTPAHATYPKRFSVLDMTNAILSNRLQMMKFLTKIVSVVLLFLP